MEAYVGIIIQFRSTAEDVTVAVLLKLHTCIFAKRFSLSLNIWKQPLHGRRIHHSN